MLKSFFSIFFVLAFPLFSSASQEATYVGIGQCRMCHLPHYESWGKTKMAKAFDLLKPGVRPEGKKNAGFDVSEDYTREEYCLECHTTGYGSPGGFKNNEETPDMAHVQCEACHGPGSIYSKMMLKPRGTYKREDYVKKGGLILPTAENNTCIEKCHNPASPFVNPDLKFDFADRKVMGTHRHDLNYIDIPFEMF